MTRSISIVEYKVQQAEFFLHKITESEFDFFAVQCFTDAFASTCRSITFSMQAVIAKVDGFEEWYAERINLLKKDRLWHFFNAYRVASVHIGDTVVHGGASFTDENAKHKIEYFFASTPDLQEVPREDVLSICTAHFTKVLNLVYEAFATFRSELDDRWYYTEENFRAMGKSFDDAVTELGFPAEWASSASHLTEVQKWRTLRSCQTAGCQINRAFQSYLGKVISGPDEE